MTKIQYLKQQAEKADRLARDVSDALTAERLSTLSREYRQHAQQLECHGDINRHSADAREERGNNGGSVSEA